MVDTPHPSADSPFQRHLGLRLVEWRDGYARLVCDTAAEHANRSGIVHGGVMLMMLDQVGGYAGLHSAMVGEGRRSVTLDLDCRFTGQAAVGARLVAEGRVAVAGRNVFFVRSEVRDGAGTLIAFGASTHRYRSQARAPE